MKKFNLSLVAILAMGTFAVAGGDIAPVEEPMVEVVAPVADDSGFYIGGAYSMANFSSDYEWHDEDYFGYREDGTGTDEVDYNAIMLQVGYQYNKYLAIEGRYWHSVGDSDYEWSNEGEDSQDGSFSGSGSDNNGDELAAWGIYVKPMYPVTDAFTIYGLLGYGNVTLNDNDGDWLDESGFQWGAGASYSFTDNLSFFVDYVELYNDEKEDEWSDGDPMYPDYHETWDDTKVYTVNFGLTYKF